MFSCLLPSRRNQKRNQRPRQLGLALLLSYLLLLAHLPTALAAEPTQIQQADDGALELGTEYVQWYSSPSAGCGGAGDIPATRPDAEGLGAKLTATYWFFPFFTYPTPRWSWNWNYGNGSAWESDWKRASAGGYEDYYVDQVDLAYFSGHGYGDGFVFGPGGCLHNDQYLSSSDASGAWGTIDMDWVAISACLILDDPNLVPWANSMNGLRLFMGYKTVMDDVDNGRPMGNYMRWGHNMTQAWFRAADDLESQGRIARVMAEHPDYWYDTWANHASFTVVDNDFHWWTHPVGSEPARYVNPAALNGEVPILQVVPLALGEPTARFSRLSSAFGVTSTNAFAAEAPYAPVRVDATNEVSVTADYQLQMDTSSGLYNYTELASLWSNKASQVYAASNTAMTAISADNARVIADNFLGQNGLAQQDAQFYEVLSDVQTDATGGRQLAGMSAADVQPMQITAETLANYEVLYSRIISYTPPVSAAGVQAAPIEFSVMGPGSKLKVYVAPQVPATVTATSLLADAVIGGVGGYRQVTQAFAADTHAPLTTSTLPTETIKLLFDKIEPLVALSYVPLAKVKSREILSSTLAYWEGPMGFQQAELIPVYSLMVKTTFENNSTSTYETYIPVNGTYMAPYAKIVVPTDVPTTLLPGATLKLQAADAAQTLATLGIDPSLTFALGTGNPDSYIYDWYLNSVATENKIGTGRALSYLIKGGGSEAHGSTEQKIILVVKDSLKASEPNTSSAEFSFVFNNIYLPAVRK